MFLRHPIWLAIVIVLSLQLDAFGESKWSIKRMIPGSKIDARSKSQQTKPAVFRKVAGDSKTLLTKTRKAITPNWMKPKKSTKKPLVHRSWQGVRKTMSSAGKKVLAPFKKLGRNEPEPPRTVSEFLALPKPKF